MSELLTTPLTQWHRENGARMAPFAGYDMPVQYDGILVEHKHTREQASVFDICHMGEFRLTGPTAEQGLDRLVTHNLATLAPGRCRYGFLLNERGGVLDDLIVYRLAADDFMLVVNAACEASDFEWISSHLPDGAALTNLSAGMGKIDLQGPSSLEALNAAFGRDFSHLKYFTFEQHNFLGSDVILSRTGYTGELGYELYVPSKTTRDFWERLLDGDRVKPAGLGARDTLRLEAGLPLYGQDLDTEHTPVEAGYGVLVKKESEFIGKQALGTVRERLVGLSIEGRRSARHHDTVLNDKDEPVGVVTSGSFAPSLGHGVALAWIKAEFADMETYQVQTSRTRLPAQRVATPFYEGTARTQTG